MWVAFSVAGAVHGTYRGKAGNMSHLSQCMGTSEKYVSFLSSPCSLLYGLWSSPRGGLICRTHGHTKSNFGGRHEGKEGKKIITERRNYEMRAGIQKEKNSH